MSASSPEGQSVFSTVDQQMMARAVQLARKGWYSTMPNPRVGCVITREGKVVGEGYHRKAGEPHAEINALSAAGEKARGATAYVTLEPCNHTGRTGPCSLALINAGVARVVYGMQDPNPLVAGGGLQRLIEAGVVVEGPLMEEEAEALNPGFIRRMSGGLPWVRGKVAVSVDGRTAMASGESQWITGPQARSDVQKLRAQSCAIVTGIGSILSDDSSLTVRETELGLPSSLLATEKQPLRVILDSNQRLPHSAKVLQCAANSLLVSATSHKREDLESSGVEMISLPDEKGQIDLSRLLTALAERQCNEVLVEAGATLMGSFLSAGLIDELIIYMAPTLLGSEARPLAALPLQKMAEQRRMTLKDIRQVGDDIRLTYYPA